MSDSLTARRNDFIHAADQFDAALQRDWVREGDTLLRDGLIQRFEIMFDTAWKYLKQYLSEVHAVEAVSPLLAIQESSRLKIIHDVDSWIQMKNTRNQTSHIYSEKVAVDAAEKLPSYSATITALKDFALRS